MTVVIPSLQLKATQGAMYEYLDQEKSQLPCEIPGT